MVAFYLCSWFSAGCLLDRRNARIEKVTNAGSTLVIPARMEDKTASPEIKEEGKNGLTQPYKMIYPINLSTHHITFTHVSVERDRTYLQFRSL